MFECKEYPSDGPRCYLHSCGRSRAFLVGREWYTDPVGTRVSVVHPGGEISSVSQGCNVGSDVS